MNIYYIPSPSYVFFENRNLHEITVRQKIQIVILENSFYVPS